MISIITSLNKLIGWCDDSSLEINVKILSRNISGVLQPSGRDCN